MMTVLKCIVDNGITLVIVAALVCTAGYWTTTRLFQRAVYHSEISRLFSQYEARTHTYSFDTDAI